MRALTALYYRQKPDLASAAFLVVAFLTGTAGALQVPTLSLFLSNEVGVRPFLVGTFYTVSAIIGILISQWLAHHSDKGINRRMLIVWCCLLGALGCVLFAFDRHYLLLITVGVVLGSFGGTGNPQVFALAREHADHSGREAVMFNSIMRAQISLAWVIGPPLAFALAIGYGFPAMYLGASAAFLGCALIVWKVLPDLPPRKHHAASHAPRVSWWRDPQVRLLFIGCTLMWTCNSMYLITMPLYITRDLGLPERTVGILMGTAAALEIPAMLIAGYYTRRFGKRSMMRFATGAGVLFYICMTLISNEYAMIAMQLLNAIFIGIIAGIGMLYFQDVMPGQIGMATTLFATSTRTGSVVAGAVAGSVAELWGYHAVFYVAVLSVCTALVCCFRMKDV
ncbi:MFS transporter [Silvimonas amylolytica]|uniref:Sugar efflux transporter SetB n=1 Tax=Silvimonas amylolytica TaxID=449663 RepID=A0ABQ2PI86_9NEIS|nr:MFS transporter [Silvimonas amylolytica]GGP24945.1 sugar efflux transporter SetB [Silvimonas amylolytica]